MPQGHKGWHSRGYIPHCDTAGLVQHTVFATVGEGDGIARHFGAHFLRDARAADIVQTALLHVDDVRYRLLAWCVMPNHVHALVEQRDGWPLGNVMHSLKSFSANGVNTAVGRTGRVWLPDYFDRFMRDDDHLAQTIGYIESNPVAAGLVARPGDWRWSSAWSGRP